MGDINRLSVTVRVLFQKVVSRGSHMLNWGSISCTGAQGKSVTFTQTRVDAWVPLEGQSYTDYHTDILTKIFICM